VQYQLRPTGTAHETQIVVKITSTWVQAVLAKGRAWPDLHVRSNCKYEGKQYGALKWLELRSWKVTIKPAGRVIRLLRNSKHYCDIQTYYVTKVIVVKGRKIKLSLKLK
jgi:hypothetical protein